MSSNLQLSALDQSGQTRFYEFGIRQSQERIFPKYTMMKRLTYQLCGEYRANPAQTQRFGFFVRSDHAMLHSQESVTKQIASHLQESVLLCFALLLFCLFVCFVA